MSVDTNQVEIKLDDTLLQLQDTIDFVAQKHRKQTRKDEHATPYVVHPVHVMNILYSCNVRDLNTLKAALLHDTVEDTETLEPELQNKFGPDVTKFVMECSDDKKLDKTTRKKLQIEHAKHASKSAKLVKGADKYSNLSGLFRCPPPKWSKEEIYGYFIWSYHVFLNIRGENSLLDNLLLGLFEKMEITKLDTIQLTEQLESYYRCINHSE
jgi:guanosine-3',5'-bis(diphosphate) 3'-pyrophosphohydrolase